MSSGKLWKKSKTHAAPAAQAVGPVVPELKKKEEEKKGGAAWLGSGAGSPSVVVRGAGSLASGGPGGFLGSARIAQVLANSFGRATWLGGLFASEMGPMLVLGGMFSPALFIVGALAISGPGFPGRDAATGSAPVTTFIPAANSALTSATMPLDPLDLAAKANKGFYEPGQAPETNDAPAQTPASEGTPDAPTPPQAPDVSGLLGQQATEAKKALNPDGFIQKMTSDRSSPGGLGAAQPKLKDSGIQMQMANSFNKPLGAKGGKMQAFARQPRPISAQKMSTSRGRASRAMGQLKMANNLSQAGATNSGEAARQYSADAFDQQRTAGVGTGGAGLSSTPNTVAPTGTGTGAPDVTDTAPPVTPENATPYQKKLDNAQKNTQMAMILMIMGGLLLAAGLALLAFADKLAPLEIFPGVALEVEHLRMIGIGMMLAGAGMLAAGAMMANAAKKQGDDIKNNYGQQDQGNVVNECADQAVNKQNCNPTPVDQPGSTVQQDVANERNATYSMDNGGPVGK